jgi:hypothetical protein
MDPSTLNFAMSGAIVVVTVGIYLLQRRRNAQQRADDLNEAKIKQARKLSPQASQAVAVSKKSRQPKPSLRKSK